MQQLIKNIIGILGITSAIILGGCFCTFFIIFNLIVAINTKGEMEVGRTKKKNKSINK